MKSKSTIPTLPDELIRVILLRLPVRCLLRLKCTCKSWYSLISDPDFAKTHFDIAAAPIYLLLNFSCHSDFKAISVDIEAPLNNESEDVVFNIPNPLPVYIPDDKRRIDIVGSCRGFVLLTITIRFYKLIYFIVWNPSTGVHRQFHLVIPSFIHLCGIGYDPSTDDYVVVTVSFSRPPRGTQVHCFSLRTNSWSSTQSTVQYSYYDDDFRAGSFLNGALHWLVGTPDDNSVVIIIAFDVKEKRLTEIPPPPELEVSLYYHRLMVMEGCLCLCLPCYPTARGAEMWMMKEYKVRSSWIKSFVLDINFYPFDSFLPICFDQYGGILGHDYCKMLVRLRDKGNLLERRKFPMRVGHERLVSNKYGLLHCGLYRESLLSLPRDNNE